MRATARFTVSYGDNLRFAGTDLPARAADGSPRPGPGSPGHYLDDQPQPRIGPPGRP